MLPPLDTLLEAVQQRNLSKIYQWVRIYHPILSPDTDLVPNLGFGMASDHIILQSYMDIKAQQLGHSSFLDMMVQHCKACLPPLVTPWMVQSAHHSSLATFIMETDTMKTPSSSISLQEKMGWHALSEHIAWFYPLTPTVEAFFKSTAMLMKLYIMTDIRTTLIASIYQFRPDIHPTLHYQHILQQQMKPIAATIDTTKPSAIAKALTYCLYDTEKNFLHTALETLDPIESASPFLLAPLIVTLHYAALSSYTVPFYYLGKDSLETWIYDGKKYAATGQSFSDAGFMVFTGAHVTDILSSFSHETMHLAMQYTYRNHEKPYGDDPKEAATYAAIWENVQQRYQAHCVPPTPKPNKDMQLICKTITEIFPYPAEQHHGELIARYAGLLASQIPSSSIHLFMEEVHHHYREVILPDMHATIAFQQKSALYLRWAKGLSDIDDLKSLGFAGPIEFDDAH